MTTANEVYKAALVLMDANADPDTTEYEAKAVSLLNTLKGDVWPYSDTWTPAPGKSICPLIETLESEMPLDDDICISVLPYGLAALLLMDENPSTASFLNQKYEEKLNDLRMGRGLRISGSMDIEDVYGDSGSNYYNRFTKWGGE